MKILIVEDDPMQVEALCELLSGAFAELEILFCPSEHQFIRDIPGYRASPPDLAIFDLMLPYYTIDECAEFTNTPDLASHSRGGRGFREAGIRCWRAFQEHLETSSIPVIIWSVVELERLRKLFDPQPLNLHFLNKEAVETTLLRLIRSSVPHYPRKLRKKPSIIDTVLDATDAKPGAFGLKVDLKKLIKKGKK